MKLTTMQFGLLGVIFAAILVLGTYEQTEDTFGTSEKSSERKKMLVPISDVSDSDILIDISQNSTKYITGSSVIPYTNFMQDDDFPKTWLEISNILGAAGISRGDNIVIYGECMPCGGGPAPATYVYWLMKSLGHKNVRVLDGNIDDWAAAGFPTSNKSQVRPSTNYTPGYTLDFVAAYDYVKSGKAQIVDARTSHEFNISSIPKAVNIPYERVLDNHTIKNETALKDVFANLSKDSPVVVFTNTGLKASVVWFALELMGYDSKLYAFQDWLGGQAYEGNTSAGSQVLSPMPAPKDKP
ncbi:MAG: hypothetical protein MUO26_08830 [Methanotrichaceae archaeon]|nr:hypothetical protein [Methanotrichaceae archaeon]